MKIISWNIANYNDHPHWETRVKLLAHEIAEHCPDLIVLQEVRFCADAPSTAKTGMNTAEQLLYELNELGFGIGYHIRTAPAMYYYDSKLTFPRNYPLPAVMAGGSLNIWEGLSIISKEPIEESSNYILNVNPPESDRNIRNVQMARIGDYTIFNTHLSYNEDEALNNAHKLVEYFKRQNYSNSILCGDFNTTIEDKAIKIIQQSGLVSVGDNTPTFTAIAPKKKIDFIFVPSSTVKQVKGIKLLGTRCNESGIFPSDHFGLLLEL